MGPTGTGEQNIIDYFCFDRGQDRIDYVNTEKSSILIDKAEILKNLVIKAKQYLNQEESFVDNKDLHKKLDMSMDKIKAGLEKVKEDSSDFYQFKKIEEVQEEIDLFKKFDEVSRNLNELWGMTGAYAPMGIPSDVYLDSKKQEEAKEFLIKTAPKFGFEGKFEKYDIGYNKFVYHKTNNDEVYSHSDDVWKVDNMKQEEETKDLNTFIGPTGPGVPQKQSHPYRDSAPKDSDSAKGGSFAVGPIGVTGARSIVRGAPAVTGVKGVTGATGSPGLNYYKKENMEQKELELKQEKQTDQMDPGDKLYEGYKISEWVNMMKPKKTKESKASQLAAKHQKELQDASGNITSRDPMVSFMYLLMRDHLKPGDVEQLVQDCAGIKDEPAEFTNGFLALYATNLVDRLK